MYLAAGDMCYASAACVLLFWVAISLRRLCCSSLVPAALAFYAILAIPNSVDIANRYSAHAYNMSGATYLLGSFSLIICMFCCGLISSPAAVRWRSEDHVSHFRIGIVFLSVSTVLFLSFRSDPFASWEAQRSESNRLDALANFLFFIGSPALASAIIAGRRQAVAALVILVVINFLLSGSRAAIFGIVAILSLSVWQRNRPISGTYRIAILMLIALSVHTVIRPLRGHGLALIPLILQSEKPIQAVLDINDGGRFGGGEDGIVDYFVWSTTLRPDPEFGTLRTVKRIALMPIPGSLWPDKPVDVSNLLWSRAVNDGYMNDDPYYSTFIESQKNGSLGSIHPTMFGEFFISGGNLSVIVSSMAIAVILSLVDWYLSTRGPVVNLMISGPTCAGMYFIARGNVIIGLGLFLYSSVIIVILSSLIPGLFALVGRSLKLKRGVH